VKPDRGAVSIDNPVMKTSTVPSLCGIVVDAAEYSSQLAGIMYCGRGPVRRFPGAGLKF